MSVGLISEFNPFHYGHQYILNKIHELTSQPVICVMSGAFVQRGEPACASKLARTKAALSGGADMVVQLPVKFSTAAAPNFARGGIEVLKNINGVTSLAFGVETDDFDALYKIAELKNLSQTNDAVKEELNKGLSYPTAIANAIEKVSGNKKFKDILDKPNNVLAIEYIEALKGTNISPLPIKRIGSGYNEKNIIGKYASATAIRESLSQGNSEDLKNYLPAYMLNECISAAPDNKIFDSLVLYALRKLSIDDIRLLPDVESGMEYSIYKAAKLSSIAAAMQQLKSKRYTYARLKRIFIYALLGINKHIMSDINSVQTRVLGIKNESKSLLKDLNSNIISRNSDASLGFTESPSVKIDAFADDIYSILTSSKANVYFETPLVVI